MIKFLHTKAELLINKGIIKNYYQEKAKNERVRISRYLLKVPI